MPDVYFSEAWGRLHETVEGGQMQTFTVQDDSGGSVRHMFILRKIEVPGFDGYDIITPYGYGGPRVISAGDTARGDLVKSFEAQFFHFCRDHKIVAEFVRFHPLFSNAAEFSSIYKLSKPRETVGTNLETQESALMAEFSKSCRKNVRRALAAGVTYRITNGPDRLSEFQDIYYDTMDRNNAKGFYYFPASYFDSTALLLGSHVLTVEALYEGRVIAMNLCFVSDGVIHIHLSGTRNEFLHLSPAYVLRHGIAEWGRERSLSLVHHGGGRSDSPDDPLLQFKRQFGKSMRFSFVTGRRIWDDSRYVDACRHAKADVSGEFFPAYRAR